MASTNAKTKRTSPLAAKKILESARRVKDKWETSGELFAGYKITKPDFEVLLTEGAEADNSYVAVVATEQVVRARLEAECKTEMQAAQTKCAGKIATLEESKRLAAEARQQKLLALSRATQGAKLFAQSTAFSDTDPANDALVKSF